MRLQQRIEELCGNVWYWPLILQINRQYFTIEEYHIKRNRFCEIYTNISHIRLSRGLISDKERNFNEN